MIMILYVSNYIFHIYTYVILYRETYKHIQIHIYTIHINILNEISNRRKTHIERTPRAIDACYVNLTVIDSAATKGASLYLTSTVLRKPVRRERREFRREVSCYIICIGISISEKSLGGVT